MLGAFDGSRCVGFLRYLIQVIGAEEGRPAVMHNGAPLREGFVEAFGVDPQLRRRGIGTALQQHAAWQCRERRVLSDAIPQPDDKRRELRLEDRRRLRATPQSRKRLLLLPPPPVTKELQVSPGGRSAADRQTAWD